MENNKAKRKLSKAIEALKKEFESNQNKIISNGTLKLDIEGQIVRLQAQIKGLGEQNVALMSRNEEVKKDIEELEAIEL